MERHGDPERPLDELCDFIVERYHAYLRRTLPLIGAELAALTEADPSIGEAQTVFTDLALDVRGHLAKEENLLFPSIVALARADREGGSRPTLPFVTVLHPIRLMETEHLRIETAMDRLRHLTHAFAVPEGAPDRWRHCLSELSRLDADLREHHRTENEVLFPHALELEQRLS